MPKKYEWKDYYAWGEDDFLTPRDDKPCVACGATPTIGVGYSNPDETKFWCAAHLPEEFWSLERKQAEAERKL